MAPVAGRGRGGSTAARRGSWAAARLGTSASPCASADPGFGLEENEVVNDRTGLVMGSGGPPTRAIVEAADAARTKGPRRVGPFAGAKGDVLDQLGDAGDRL